MKPISSCSINSVLSAVLLLSFTFILTACSGDPEHETLNHPTISLNKNELTLEVGSSERLEASFDPFDTENKAHVWSSSDKSVATVDETGLVTAVAEGEATIEAKALAGGSKDYCKVTVIPASPKSPAYLEGGIKMKFSSTMYYMRGILSINNSNSCEWDGGYLGGTSMNYTYEKNGERTAYFRANYIRPNDGYIFRMELNLEFFGTNYGKYSSRETAGSSVMKESGTFKLSSSSFEFPSMTFDEIYLSADNPQNDSNIGEAVDLGLSVLWSDRNLGALNADEIGYFYRWGATTPAVDWASCLECDTGVKEDDISGSVYDAAFVKWGGKWRMPTLTEAHELFDKCKQYAVYRNGTPCLLLSSENGNQITLPYSTPYVMGSSVNRQAWYWTSTADGDKASYFRILYNDKISTWFNASGNYLGNSIRPVCDK